MLHGRRHPVVALLVAGVAGVAVMPTATAGAATITACVKSKTGDVRIRSGPAAKRKCPKGWTKVRWNTTGAAGKQGIPGIGTPGAQGLQGLPGPAINVKDASGAIVGQFTGSLLTGFPVFSVLREGGLYVYLGSGQLFPFGARPSFKTTDCSGAAFLRFNALGAFTPATFLLLTGGHYRVVFRTNAAGVLGPASAWKARGTTEAVVAMQLYQRDPTTGACAAEAAAYTGDLEPLDSVTAPPDFTGPLTIG